MGPQDIEQMARRKYNALGDTFWSQSEIMDLIYQACMTLAQEAQVIERTFTTNSVIGQQEYAYPTNTISIKRLTYDGKKLKQITFREDDEITLLNQATTESAVPRFYYIWNEALFLRPLPDDVKEIKMYCYIEPQTISATSTLEVPTQFHLNIVDYVVSEMAMKDSNLNVATLYKQLWAGHVANAKRWTQKRKRGDSPAYVLDEDSLPGTILGTV